MLRREARPRRNARCFCGSGKKYKHCHAKNAVPQPPPPLPVDLDDIPVRFVIANSEGRAFFSTKDGKIMVFTSAAGANAIARLPDFDDQVPGEINVVGIGETKWSLFRERLPFVEFDDSAHEVAARCIRDKLEFAREQYESETEESSEEADTPDTASDK